MSALALCSLLALAAGPPAEADTLDGTVHGRIVSEATGAPVRHALVLMEHPSRPRSTLSDSTGRYRLEEVPPGPRQLRVGAPGYIPLEVVAEVPAGRELVIDVVLPIRPISMPEITAVGELDASGDHLRARATTLRAAPEDPELRALEASPAMARLGFRTGEPGPPDEDGSGLLHVRGSASDFKLVLLDGAPVYAPFHLAGLTDAAHPGVLESSRLFVGGAPARFGGALSHVLLLETRRGGRDGFATAGAVDLLGGRARVEGDVGGSASYLVAARGLHGAEPGGLTEGGLPYDYGETLGRVDVELTPGLDLSATGFRNRESVRLDGPDLGGESARWGNTAGSVRLRTRPGPREAVLTAAIGRFESHLPLNGGSVGTRSGASERVRLAADVSRREGAFRIGYGAFYGRDAIVLRTDRRVDGSAGEGGEESGASPATGRAGWRVGTVAEEAGAYGELTWRPESRLTLRGGLRADGFLSAGQLRLGPRLAAEWRAGQSSVLSAALGRYHQYVRPPESILSAEPGDLGTTAETPLSSPGADEPGATLGNAVRDGALSVADASHAVVGLRHRAGPDLTLGMEGYYRIYEGLPGASGRRASGVDLWFDWKDGPWKVGAGYSLLFSWLENADPETARRFSGRQLLAAALEAPLPSGLGLELRLSNAAGLPFTPLPTAGASPETASGPASTSDTGTISSATGAAPEGRSASYLRLDATISGTWSTRLLGSDTTLTPYLRVLNALDRRDALFYRFGGEPGPDGEARSLSSIPLLPVVGVEWAM